MTATPSKKSSKKSKAAAEAAAPAPGDLVCQGRERFAALRFADLPAGGYFSHCDIVVGAARGGAVERRQAEEVHHHKAADVAQAQLPRDLDGGFGREQSPRDLETIADLAKIPALLQARGYSDADARAIASGNALAFLERALPA